MILKWIEEKYGWTWHIQTMRWKFYFNRIHKVEKSKIVFRVKVNNQNYLCKFKRLCSEIMLNDAVDP